MLTAICLGAFLSHFTAGIVNVSLPQFVDIFHSSLGTVQWITTGYLLVIACLLPVMGKLGDRYGYGLIHNFGYIVFTVSSVLVATSPSIAVLLILRMAQAVGAAMFQATNIALVTVHMPKENRGRALGMIGTAVALGGMTGPVAGGLIAEWFSWHWLFLVHAPVAIIASLLAFRFIPLRRAENKQVAMGGAGAILFMAAIGMVIFAISKGNTWGWLSAPTISLTAAGLLALAAFLLRERRQTAPFLPIKAFRHAAVSSGLLVSVATYMFANTLIVSLPFYLAGMPDMSPSASGLIMAAYPIVLAVSGPIAGHMSDRIGSTSLLFIGLGAMGVGFAVFALLLGQWPMFSVIAVLTLAGLGMGLIASPNMNYIMQRTPAEHVGSMGGMIALTRNLGLVIGAALGLGVANGVAKAAPAHELDEFRSIFEINIVLCLAVMALFGYGVYLDKRRSRRKQGS